MFSNDFSTTNSVLDGKLSIVSAYNVNALPNSETEVHAHYDRLEVYYFLKGDLYFAFEGKRIPVENGSMIIIDSGTLHRPIIKKDCQYYRKRILINRELLNRFNTEEYDFYGAIHKQQIMFLDKDTVVSSGCDKLFEETEKAIKNNTNYDNFCAMISLFSLLIKAEKSSAFLDFSKTHHTNKKIADILEYINRNIKEDLSYKFIAEKFYISEKNLYKIFKKETGFTLSDYIKERRIIKALALLNSGLSANKVAEEVGFADYSVFYRVFTKKVGLTPSDYIKKIS